MKLNEKILALRKSKGLSQEELAEKLNVSRQAVSRWEVGTAQPDASNILQISRLFNVTADYLLNDDFESDCDIPKVKSTQIYSKHRINFIISSCISALGFIGNFIIYIISRCVKVNAPLKYYDYEDKIHKYLYDGVLRINYKCFIEEYNLMPLTVILWILSLIGILLILYNIPAINKKIKDFKNSLTHKHLI